MQRLTSTALAVVAALMATASAAVADTLAEIRDKGVLVMGVKNDYRPWGFLNSDGEIVGMEIDMANAIAERIGVRLEMIPVIAANRMEFLQQGQIDIILATMGDTPARREVIGMIEPQYYAGGTNVLAPKSANLTEWEQLRGRPVCGVQGAYYNRRVSEVYGPQLVSFPGVPEAANALLQGSCVAFLFDDTLFGSWLASEEARWADYEMPLTSEDPQPWAIGVRLEDLDAPLGELLKEMSEEWHRNGTLLALEEKWGIQQSPFLVEKNAAFN